MKREIDVPGNKLVIFYRIMVILMLLLVALLIVGSLYGLLRPKDSGPLIRIGNASKGGNGSRQGGTQGSGNAVADSGTANGALNDGTGAYSVFSGIGTLRIQNTGKSVAPGTGSPEPAVIIISISFPYKADDRAFTEELASNLVKFRSIATNYFANLPRDTLVRLDEEKAKSEILKQYNALLRLGKIETLYFGDLMIMD